MGSMKPALSVANPELAREWDYEKNAPLTPDDITAGSNKKVWWICSACNNVWQSSVYNRSNNRGWYNEKSRVVYVGINKGRS